MLEPEVSEFINVVDEECRDLSSAPSLVALFPFISIDSLAASQCWEWSGSVSSAGLPHRSAHRHTSSVSLRRLVWTLLLGPLRGGLHPDLKDRSCELVTSTCSNKRCLRPSHLCTIAGTDYKPAPRETYQGIGPRKIRPLTPLSILRRSRAERLLRLKREGYTNKAAAQAVGLSIKNAEKIFSGKVFPFLQSKGTWKASTYAGRLTRRKTLASGSETRLTVDC